MQLRPHAVLLSALFLSPACVSPEGSLMPDASRPPRDAAADTRNALDDAALDAGPLAACHTVSFALESASARTVWVTGSFLPAVSGMWPRNPSEGALELTRDASGTFRTTTTVARSGTYTYKLIVDGTTYIPDPANPLTEPDGFGGQNSVLEVCSSQCGELSEFDWRDSVMYFAMVDRFRDSDGMSMPVSGASEGALASGQYEGGDLQGARERLPYLADLGVTAIWLSAPYENRNTAGPAIDPGSDPRQYSAYHGYWPSPANVDFTDPLNPSPRPMVEPRIGTDADLHALVDGIHGTTGRDGHGMKILFDYVMKHVDAESGLFRSHPDWFVNPITTCAPDRWDDSYWGTRCSFTTYLPSFDYYNEAPRRWSVSDAVWWAREYELDGLRLDAVKHIPTSWMTDLRDRLDEAVPTPAGNRFYLVGETFDYFNRETLRSFVDPEEMLDGQFDFPFKRELCQALFRPEGSLEGFRTWMDGNDSFYGPGALMTTWIGNHDIPRAIHFASGQLSNCTDGSSPSNGWNPGAFTQPTDAAPYERLALAFVVMYTNPGIPLLYYGDEIGLAGGGDPDNRRMMTWEDQGATLLPPQIRLRDTVRALGRIRGENHVLGRGRRVTLSVSQDTWVYRLTGCGGAGAADVIVAINRADSNRGVSIPGGTYDDLVAGSEAMGGMRDLPPRSFLMLRAR
jgi:glycosidase